jgi:VanZ family protein
VSNLDKWAHFILFFGLAGTVFLQDTLYFKRAISRLRISLGSFLLPLVFGGIIELLQRYLTTSRSADWWDFLCDAAGSFIGLIICWIINRRLGQ